MDPSEFLKDYNNKVTNSSISNNSNSNIIDEIDDYDDYVDYSTNDIIDEIDDYDDLSDDTNSLTKLNAFGDIESQNSDAVSVADVHEEKPPVCFGIS